jgi:hypothetical protein
MALEGTLRDFSLADIFQLIGLQRKTGVLTLRSKEDVVTVSFLDGKVVASDSLNKRLEDRLGQVLLKSGMLSQSELDGVLKTQMETLERLGHILLRHQIISRDQLKKALEQQILQIIFRVFRWQDGDYHFSQETSVDYDVDLVTPVSAESILMEGARMLDEWPIIEKRIPHRGIVFVATPAARNVDVAPDEEMEETETFDVELEAVPAPAPKRGSAQVRISFTEFGTLKLVDGVSTVEDILRMSPHGEFETCKALYTLLTRSLIREATRDELASANLTANVAATASSAPTRLPWLAVPMLGLLIVSAVLAPRNPLNPLLGPGQRPGSRLTSAVSRARMIGIWKALQAHALLVGVYPETLGDLVRERLVDLRSLRDPWQQPYRYVLREQSVLLAGNTKNGVPDPNLIISQHLGSALEDEPMSPRAILLTP